MTLAEHPELSVEQIATKNDEVQISFNTRFIDEGEKAGEIDANASSDRKYALVFLRSTNGRNGTNGTNNDKNDNAVDGVTDAVFKNGYKSELADKITISFKLALRTADRKNNYISWTFKDVNGTEFAYISYDIKKGFSAGINNRDNEKQIYTGDAQTWAMAGKDITITAIKNEQNKYDVTYSWDDGTGDSVKATDTIDSINGFRTISASVGSYNEKWAGGGMIGLKITYELPETVKTVTATYSVNDEAVATETGNYDSAVSSGYKFPEKYYCVDGGELYYTKGQTLADTGTITMNPFENDGPYKVNEYVAINGKSYKITGANVIPNGNFSLGTISWFTGQKYGKEAIQTSTKYFKLNGDGTVSSNCPSKIGGDTSEWCLYRSWPIEEDAKYLFTFFTNSADGYQVLSLSNSLGQEAANDKGVFGKNMANGTKPQENPTANQTNSFIFDSGNYKYAKIRFRWNEKKTFGNFSLYKVEEDAAATAKDINVNYTCGDTVVKTIKVNGIPGTPFTSDVAGTILTKENERYYVLETVSTRIAINGTHEDITVPVKKIGNTFTVAIADGKGTVRIGDINDDEKYTYEDNFFTGNWDGEDKGTYDRIGVAVLDVNVKDGSDYALAGTRFRWHINNNSANKVEFYAVSKEIFDDADISTAKNLTDLLTDSNKVIDSALNKSSYENDKTDVKIQIPLITEKLKAAAGSSGKVVILSVANNGLFGISGKDIRIAEVPAKPVVALGYDEAGKKFRFLVTSENATSIKANVDGEEEQSFIIGENSGIALSTSNEKGNASNAIYTFKGVNDDVESEASDPASIYSLVTEALKTGFDADNKIKNIDAVNAVVSAGGLATDDKGTLNEQAQVLFKLEGTTLSVQENLYNAGVRIKSLTYTVSDGEEKTATSEDEGKSVTLDGVAVAQGIDNVITFEAVELEFVETEIAESADEGVDSEIDFIKEL